LINARAETVADKPAFRRAFATRRTLIPADGFYEWFPTQQIGRSGKPLKQPFFIHRADGQILALAGIYEFWRDPDRPEADDAWVSSFAVITTTATDDVGHIHDRMPMTVTPDRWQDWLDPRVSASEAADLMAPPAPGELEVFAVSRAVNNVGNNRPDLVQPIPESDGGI
jgi:putative SOS response-associated peptidase YedK